MDSDATQSPEGAISPETTTPPGGSVSLAALRQEAAAARRRLSEARRETTPEGLCRLERDLLELSSRAAEVEPDAAGAGHPLLAVTHQWRKLCERMELPGAVSAAEQLVGDCTRDEAREWSVAARSRLARPTAESCFEGLMQTTALQLELLGEHGGADVAQEFQELRGELREAFSNALAGEETPQQQRDHWRTELVDRCEVILTSIEDLEPADAGRRLQLVMDDVRWHLRHVENRGAGRRRLGRKLAKLRAEQQERALQSRLEGIFGRAAVARFERLILALIGLVLAILVAEMSLDLSQRTLLWLAIIDTAACAVFLWEFAVKIYLVPGRWNWFRRHALVDLFPSIPFGLLSHAADPLRAGRALRLLRLGRLVRYVRILRPLIRLVRAAGFLTRGLDRLARRYGRLLNRNVILYPTRAERAAGRRDDESLALRLGRWRDELHHRWARLLHEAPPEGVESIALARIAGLQEARRAGLRGRSVQKDLRATRLREIPAESLLRRLATCTPRQIVDDLGEELVGRLGRWVRVFSRPPICWLPIVRRYVPRLTAGMSESEMVAAAGHSLAAGLKQYYDRWFWIADLYGTVSPSQLLDRLGSMMVRTSFRPAYRLVLFGGVYLITVLVLAQLPTIAVLQSLMTFLERVVGTTLMVLGGVCFVVLGIGWWLKRIAREATEYYDRVAQAQFLPLTELVRARRQDRDIEVLYRRVLRHEWALGAHGGGDAATAAQQLGLLLQHVRGSLIGEHRDDGDCFQMLERVVLLYRDALDGAVFVDNDTRSTDQLLGNPAVQQLLSASRRVTGRQRRALLQLDLERQKALFGGPYLWFNFITRSISYSVACLMVEYNRNAIPLAELPLAEEGDRRRYEGWLHAAAGQLPQPPSVEEAENCITTAFTALHFLDCDPGRDREVQRQFGPDVLARMQTDRRLLIRRVFGTYPLHQLPKDQRVLNLYTLYSDWLSGGRMWFLPMFVFARALEHVGGLLGWIRRAIDEIRHPERRAHYASAAEADFATAVRKIHRMRGPIVMAAMRLRAMCDPEYLGVPLPGRAPSHETADALWDLRFLDADPSVMAEFRRYRRRAEADMRRLNGLLRGGLLERVARQLNLAAEQLAGDEHLRAAATAYLADYRGVRRLLSAEAILQENYRAAQGDHQVAALPWPRTRLRMMFRRYWKQNGFGGRAAERAAWRATIHNLGGVQGALDAWCRHGPGAAERGERILADVLRHPARISEQLVSLRTIQTLAVLDVLQYREHVFQLGEYEQTDDPGALLTWGPAEEEPQET